MGIENYRAESALDLPVPMDGEEAPRPLSPLDSDKAKQLHGKLMGGYLYEKRRQAGNRYQMALDHDYYDSIQLTDEDIAELVDRGQAPLVYNLVKRTADWVIGTEKRTRIDFKVLGRSRTQQEVEAARSKSEFLKYLSDVNKSPWHRSQAFRECVISGLGWMETGVRADPDEEPIYARKESWRNILHDSHAAELDGSDMMYLYRYKYVDLEVGQAMFPDRAHKLQAATIGAVQADDDVAEEYYLGNRISGQDYQIGNIGRYQTNTSFSGFLDNSRDRVKLIECWYRKPVKDQILMARDIPSMHRLRYNPKNDDHRHAVIAGDASVIERVNMGVFYCIMTESDLLATGRSPYRHNQFPFTPIWCYRRGRDNAPYGMIRPIRDPQDGFNRRMSKSIFALSAYRVTMDSDAIDAKVMDYEDIRREAGRPDALIVKRAGKEIRVDQDRALAEGHMKLAEYEAGLILDSSGVTADNLGMESNAQSGKAIIAKQSEGSAVTSEIFDNLRLGNQIHGEKELSLTEQYVTDERIIRVTDARGRPTWKKVNEIVEMPDGSVRVLNDITATKSDFVIDQQDFNVSLRQQASQQLFDLAGKLTGFDPMMVLQIIDMAIDQSNLPEKDELLKRIRSMTGYQSPEDALTPEEQQAQQDAKAQQDQQAQQQAEQQAALANADLDTKLADAQKKKAEAEKILAEAGKIKLEAAALAQGGDNGAAQQLADVQARAQEQIDTHANTIAQLQGALKDRADEIAATREAAMHKADQEREAAMHAANKSHEAAVRTAELQYSPTSNPAHEEAQADMLQAVEEVKQAMADFEKRVADAEKKDEKAEKDLLANVEKAIEKTVAAAVKAQPAEKSEKPAQPLTVNVGPIVVEGKPQGTKTITISPDGKSAKVEHETKAEGKNEPPGDKD